MTAFTGPCAETDPELFFPERGDDATANTARKICRTSCPSRVECLTFALTHHMEGIWGGFNEKGRDRAGRLHRAGKPLEDIIAEDDAVFYDRHEAEQEQARIARDARLARRRIQERARTAAVRGAAA